MAVTYLRDAPDAVSSMGNRRARVVVRCPCGVEFEVDKASLNRTKRPTKSCGCHRRLVSKERATKHGRGGHPTYRVWTNMRARCRPGHPREEDWYARGIRVCERWDSFENFLADMGSRPVGATLDRVDNDGNYDPANCRWATPTQQQNNKRSSRLIEYRGKSKTLAEWCRELGIPYPRTQARIDKLGWSAARAFEE